MRATELHDEEFGVIAIRRSAAAKYIRLRVDARGRLTASMPRLAPVFMLKTLLNNSRPQLREALAAHETSRPRVYHNHDQVGASHRIVQDTGSPARTRLVGLVIRWTVPEGADPASPRNQEIVRTAVRKALDKEAKAYLPRRLRHLADTYGFTFSKVRYSNAKGRWGSCSSRGVISLNVALMNLPMEYVDYVLVHELSHTRHLNHSAAFWAEVERCFPHYKAARKQLKTYSPYL